ncbi:hypothetical protein [Croceivirga radicis]|nr:hypothetical protein [Croceivirga radicis]
MEKVKEIFMRPLFWGITVGHLALTVLASVASIIYIKKLSK